MICAKVKRVGQREGKYSCIAHSKDTSEHSYPCGGVAVAMTARVNTYLGN